MSKISKSGQGQHSVYTVGTAYIVQQTVNIVVYTVQYLYTYSLRSHSAPFPPLVAVSNVKYMVSPQGRLAGFLADCVI